MEIKITINDKLINVFKKVFTRKTTVFFIAVILFCGGLVLFTQQVVELNTFHDGDVIDAGPINENFQALKERELGSLDDVDVSGVESGQYLQYVTGTWVASDGKTVDGDDLGNHTAISNINLNNNYLSGDGDSEGVFVAGNGNVGIGTTNPGDNYMLHIQGGNGGIYSIATSGTNSCRPFGVTADISTNAQLNTGGGFKTLFNTSNTPNIGYVFGGNFHINDDGNKNVRALALGVNYAESDDYVLELNTTDPGYAIYSHGSGIVYIGGNVGIGTTDPTSKLQVTGLPIHTNNEAANEAGLTAGAFYHNGDGIVRVVY